MTPVREDRRRRARRHRRACALALAATPMLLGAGALAPAAAEAHGISGLASLPVPAWLFAWAAAIVLVVSFVLLSTLWSAPRLQERHERRLFAWPRALDPLAGLIGVALLVLVVYAGYAGAQVYTSNLDPTFIYVVFWVGVPVASVLLGDWFNAFSPWRAIARAIGWAMRHLHVRRPGPLPYPPGLGRWPAAAGLVAFAWLELVYHQHDVPSLLASLTLAYTALMLAGIAVFGLDTWSERADAFGVYFKMLGRLSSLTVHDRALWLRRPLSGVPSLAEIPGTTAVVLAVIGTTTFDGASNGVVWETLQPHVQSFFTGTFGLGDTAGDELADSIGLLLALVVVTAFYRLGVLGMRSVSRRMSSGQLSRTFAHTLVPIAFAYVLAHYFSLLIWQGQATAYLASNPLGHGTDYLGTAHWHVHYDILSFNAIWCVQVAALVAGHVCGLALAHDRALVTFRSARQAVQSQYWMLVVMVGFTSLGLWLLSSVNT